VGAPPPHPTWLTKDDLPRHTGQPHKIFFYVGSNLKKFEVCISFFVQLKKESFGHVFCDMSSSNKTAVTVPLMGFLITCPPCVLLNPKPYC
jgi:hypothetical protein